MIALNDREVSRAMIGGWWYNVEPHTFSMVRSTDKGVEYAFKYYPKSVSRFGNEPSTMHVEADQITALKYEGDK